MQLDLRTMYLKQLQLHGSSQGTRADFRRIVRYIEEKKIRPLVGGVYRLSDFHRAQTDFMAKDFVGMQVAGISANPDVPVHPGLAKFLKEHKAWDEKWKASAGS